MTTQRFPFFVRTGSDPAGQTLIQAPDVVFHHLPKTAGSTFRRILESHFDPEEICPGEIDAEVHELDDESRRRFRLYAGHFTYKLLTNEFADAVWLTFLRNPIERVVSNWHNLTNPDRHKDQWRQRVAARPEVQRFVDRIAGMPLDEFVHLDHPGARDRVENRQTLYLIEAGRDPLNPVGQEFPQYDAAMVEEAKRNLRERFPFVGVQEHFDLSLQLFAMTFGLRPFGNLDAFTINTHPEKRRGQRYELTDDLRDYLETHNQMDLELWRYAESLLFERLHAFHDHLMSQDSWLRHQDLHHLGSSGPNAPTRSLTVPVDRLRWRQGFHRIEHDGLDRPFCWSGYEDPAVMEVEYELPSRGRVEVRVVALEAISDAARNELCVTFDRRPLDDLSLREEDGRLVFRGTVSADGWPRRHHAIMISGPRALEPESAEDRRLLGVAVHAVELTAI